MSFADATGRQAPSQVPVPSQSAQPAKAGPVNPRLQAFHAALRYRLARERGCRLWVSTDLAVQTMPGAEPLPEDLICGSKCFRLLTPDHFLWLEDRFAAFQSSQGAAGNSSSPEAHAFTVSFDAIRTMATGLFTQADFDQAKARLALAPLESPNRGNGKPAPCAFSFPEAAGIKANRQVTTHALGEVDSIREAALAAGWTEAELYQTKGRFAFPCGGDYGVVCFVHPGQRLGQVSPASIELICRDGHALNFYRRTAA